MGSPLPPRQAEWGAARKSRGSAYYHSRQPDPLVQLAILHAQFEIFHPFSDGNGRMGRMLVPLFLYETKLLHTPTFYLSGWLEPRREEYVSRLRALGRRRDAWSAWVEFFLLGVAEQADSNAAKAQAILALYNRLKEQALDLTHSQFAVPLLDQLFARPVLQSRDLRFGKKSPSKPAVANLLRTLREAEILGVVREGAGRRGTVYALKDLINRCEGRIVFR
ncbi:MAG: Fic family protein [Casimicrobiaceae bacterium]